MEGTRKLGTATPRMPTHIAEAACRICSHLQHGPRGRGEQGEVQKGIDSGFIIFIFNGEQFGSLQEHQKERISKAIKSVNTN